MERYGFIQDELELKTLILYALERAALPVAFEDLTEMCLCDDGVDYFEYAASVADLVGTGHVSKATLDGAERYFISAKGRQNLDICKKQLSPAARRRADEAVEKVSRRLRRSRMVKAELVEEHDNRLTVLCRLSDDTGEILNLRMSVLSKAQANILIDGFQKKAERIYNAILAEMTGG